MTVDRRTLLAAMGSSLALAPFSARAQGGDLEAAAAEAWLFGLPLIEMAAARTRMLNGNGLGANPGGVSAEINQLVRVRTLAGPESRAVTTPNNDTLYASAFIDLSQSPITLTIPATGRRYFSLAVMDMYTNNNVVLGARTPGGAAGEWRLLGPGQVASGPRDIQILTPEAWVLARVLVDGPDDLPAATAVQDKIILKGPAAPKPPAFAKRSDPWSDYFKSVDALMKTNPPTWQAGRHAFDQVKNASPARDFDPAGFSAEDAARIAAGVEGARQGMASALARTRFHDGWNYPPKDVGQYQDDFVVRAGVAVAGLGALPIQEALYLKPESPEGGGVFKGDGLYRFSLTSPLPVGGFWSLSMYEATPDGQFFFTQNPINRYAIGDRTPGIVKAASGGLDIFIGRTDPGGEKSANWLPAPAKGPFAMVLRTYLPGAELLSHAYKLPPIVAA
jgi:hypothetical protein